MMHVFKPDFRFMRRRDSAAPSRWWQARASLWTALFLVVVLTGYAWIQIANFMPAYLEVDPDGYLWMAKRMARGERLAVPDTDPFLYQTHVWVETQRGDVLPKFAPGYPVLMAVAYRVGGDLAMFAVSPIMGVLTLIGIFCLARLWGCNGAMAVCAAAAPVLTQMYPFYTGYLLTHSTNMAVVAWGFVFLWSWLRRPERWGPALAAGLLLGFSVHVRHSDAVLALPVVLAAVWTTGEALVRRRTLRPLGPALILLAAYAVGPVLLGLYHLAYFGRFAASGYDLSAEQAAFSWRYFWLHARRLNTGLAHDVLFLLFPLGFVGCLTLGSWKERLLRLGWCVPVYVLYSTYYFSSSSQSAYRFMLVLLPLFVPAAFAFLQQVLSDPVRRRVAVAAVLALIALDRFDSFRNAWQGELYQQPRPLAMLGHVLDRTVEDDAVLFLASRSATAIGTRRRYTAYNLDAFTADYGARAFRPWRYHPYRAGVIQQESRRARFAEFYRAHSEDELQAMKKERVAQWLAAGRQVVFVLPKGEARREAARLLPELELHPLRTVNLLWWRDWGIYEAVRSDAEPASGNPSPDRSS